MQLWQVIKYCADGSYLNGDTFINEQGQIIVFNGKQLIGLDGVALDSAWEHIDEYNERTA